MPTLLTAFKECSSEAADCRCIFPVMMQTEATFSPGKVQTIQLLIHSNIFSQMKHNMYVLVLTPGEIHSDVLNMFFLFAF